MRRFPTAFLALLIGLAPSSAAWAKPKGCFSQPEIVAEQEIRHGIFLREAAKLCDGRFLKGSDALWRKFATANDLKFKTANDKRKRAWQREFPDDWQYKITHADGALVTFNRNIPLTQGFCDNVDDLLQTVSKRGYAGLSGQAKLLRNEVVQDYRICQ